MRMLTEMGAPSSAPAAALPLILAAADVLATQEPIVEPAPVAVMGRNAKFSPPHEPSKALCSRTCPNKAHPSQHCPAVPEDGACGGFPRTSQRNGKKLTDRDLARLWLPSTMHPGELCGVPYALTYRCRCLARPGHAVTRHELPIRGAPCSARVLATLQSSFRYKE